jgi:two-component system, chemotaxis family, protein-glutamate methylesterase/glutaminase
MIDVLIVDDSLTAREFIKHIFAGDAEIRVIGEAKNGAEALRFVEKRRPDVVVMDIRMPGMNGYETTRAMMEICPVPIIIHSSLAAPGQNDIVFQAMNAGAVAVSQKPSGPGHPESRQMIRKADPHRKAHVRNQGSAEVQAAAAGRHGMPGPHGRTGPRIEIIGIGASTGGPPVLQALLSSLSPRFPNPIIIVQHITAGFLSGMVSWLSKHTPMMPFHSAHRGGPIRGPYLFRAGRSPPGNHADPPLSGPPHCAEIALKRPITHLFLNGPGFREHRCRRPADRHG